MAITQHNPMHPGEFIKRVYMKPHDIGSNELARMLRVSPGIVSRIVNGKAGLSSEMALKLSKVLGRSPESWLLMQDNYDLWHSRQMVNLDDYQKIDLKSA